MNIVKRQKLEEIMKVNPLMSVKEAQEKYEQKYKEPVSVSLVYLVRDKLTGREPKVTIKKKRVIEFIRENPGLTGKEIVKAYKNKYPDDKLSPQFYFECKKLLNKNKKPESIENIVKKVKLPRVIESVKLHKLIIKLGGLEKFEEVLAEMEKLGNYKHIRKIIETIKPEL